MQQKKADKHASENGQEKENFLLSVLKTIWREFRSLISLNFTLDLFIVFPTLFIMAINVEWPMAVITIFGILSILSVVSIPAALLAANKITISMVRQENFFLNSDFWKTFAHDYFKALGGGLFFGVILGLLTLSGVTAFQVFGEHPLSFIILAVVLSGGIVFYLASLYFWPMLALIDLPLRPIIKNSVLIVPAAWKQSLIALLVTLFFVVFLGCFIFSSVFFLVGFIFLSLYILSINFALYPAISRLVILRQSPKKRREEITTYGGGKLTWENEEEEDSERKD